MSLSAVIDSVEREMFDRATREKESRYCDGCKGYKENKDRHMCIKQEFNDRRRESEKK